MVRKEQERSRSNNEKQWMGSVLKEEFINEKLQQIEQKFINKI